MGKDKNETPTETWAAIYARQKQREDVKHESGKPGSWAYVTALERATNEAQAKGIEIPGEAQTSETKKDKNIVVKIVEGPALIAKGGLSALYGGIKKVLTGK